MPCGLLVVYHRFWGMCFLDLQGWSEVKWRSWWWYLVRWRIRVGLVSLPVLTLHLTMYHHQLPNLPYFNPEDEDGGGMFLWNVDTQSEDYIVQQLRRPLSKVVYTVWRRTELFYEVINLQRNLNITTIYKIQKNSCSNRYSYIQKMF